MVGKRFNDTKVGQTNQGGVPEVNDINEIFKCDSSLNARDKISLFNHTNIITSQNLQLSLTQLVRVVQDAPSDGSKQ